MADITISDLELAPALADDMVLAVENTTDTYAATLAMLRRLINKTFVEVENADFNALIDDGFYQCTGTPTNSPVAGSINWTLQVSAESGVIVQRAFSLDDNFANLYIRRWNGVTWTGWLEVGAGALANKADIDASNFNADGKSLLSGLGCMSNGILISQSFATSTNFTAPANGWFKFRGVSTASPSRCFMANISVQGVPAVGGDTPASGALANIILRVKKGDIVSFQYINLNIAHDDTSGAWFYPDVGEI